MHYLTTQDPRRISFWRQKLSKTPHVAKVGECTQIRRLFGHGCHGGNVGQPCFVVGVGTHPCVRGVGCSRSLRCSNGVGEKSMVAHAMERQIFTGRHHQLDQCDAKSIAVRPIECHATRQRHFLDRLQFFVRGFQRFVFELEPWFVSTPYIAP